MGIPKFYRWTSERYPCLYEKIREYQIPEFDNLYLDMNGIIHNCSHPNDEDVHLRIPEENIFRDIFHYIDFLFRMIKPCRVFFMDVDGVAPRAKMNQQRGRRFRSARVAEEQEAEALRQGEKLPTVERFDSNCITPGTEFMARLHEQLKYFVAVKISTDPLWQRQGLCVYLSGHDVPGEGEHKIMDFIRHIRSQPNYDPETRHCLYGLDADLMMLGLSTHELRFSLLREEVKFTKPKKKKSGKTPPQKKAKGDKNEAPVMYDLTNVSVFSAEDNMGLKKLESTATASTSSVAVPNLQGGKTFVDAINIIPMPTPAIQGDSSKNSSSATDGSEPPAPPPADDHNAKGDYKAPLPEKTTFFLLHLSLFRDYLDEEFKELRLRLENHPKITYNLENLIDDWILMNILVGNDFVPHLPNLHIVKGALPMLYRTYMDVLPTLDGYLNESGTLNLKRFEIFITRLSQFDLDQFRETYDDMKYKASKTGKNIVLGEKMFEDFIFEDDTPFEEDELEPVSDELKALARRTEDEIFGNQNNSDGNGFVCKDVFPEDRDFFGPEDTEEFRLEFLQHKRNYYLTKCEFKKVDRVAVHEFAKEYVRAIQWVLLYYYKGVSSWGWFYPSHYAPFASDLRCFGDYQIEFVKGQPFKPFEQLLAVLPSQSKKLLPACYQWLMTEEQSPILEYYPKKFEQDLNGKRQDWEAVVLIPFIDESKLLGAMQTEVSKLSQEEVFRNSRGSLLCHSYTKEATGPIKSHRDIFPELEVSHVKLEKIDEVLYNPELLPRGLHPKANVSKIYQGFPSLKSKTFESCICKAEVKVFEFYAREESLILSFEDVIEEVDPLKLGKKILGKSIWVNWPHLEAALVSAIYTRGGKYILGRDNLVIKDPRTPDGSARKTFEIMAKGLVEKHLKFRGIRLGELDVIVFARLMEGRKIRCNKVGKVVIENQLYLLSLSVDNVEQPFALKTAIYEEKVTEMFYMDEATAKSYLDLFRKGDQVFYLGDKLFGAMGVVIGHDRGSGSILLELKYPQDVDESNLKLKTGMKQLKSQDFFPPYLAASKCQISSFALSRLTGRVLVSVERKKPSKKVSKKKDLLDSEEGLSGSDSSESSIEEFPALEPEVMKYNIGLDLKFNKTNMEVRGYTSKRDGQWFYSANTIKLVNEYVCKFPEVVELLGRADKSKDVYNAADIFPGDSAGRAMEIVDWLENRGVRNLPRIPTNCNVLDDADIDTIWNYITSRDAKRVQEVRKTWSARPNLLYKPGLDKGCIAPIPNAQFSLLDRVICVDRGASIPLGLRGTVVGIQAPPKSQNDDEEAFKTVSSDALNALIIMCDPATDIFDTPNPSSREKENGDLTELTGSLAKLLGVNGPFGNKEAAAKPKEVVAQPLPVKQKTTPKLVKLFPYQVINLTQGSRDIRQELKKSIPASNPSSNRDMAPLINGTVIIPTKSYAQSVSSGPNGASMKVLQRPSSSKTSKENGKVPAVQPESQVEAKPILPWPPQPMSRSITVEQLFAQAAKEQQPSSNSKPRDNVKMIPAHLLKMSGITPTKLENTSSQSHPKALLHTKVVIKKKEPGPGRNLTVVKVSTNDQGQSKPISSKVFVNSALTKNTRPHGNSKVKVDGKTSTPRAATGREIATTSADSQRQNNQILNLLCQLRNLQRVTSHTDLKESVQGETNANQIYGQNNGDVIHSQEHQDVNPLQALDKKLRQRVQQNSEQPAPPMPHPQSHAGFSHPVFINSSNPQFLPHEFYVPSPYPINPALNPLAAAFVAPNVVYFNPPPAFRHPPPPPQQWTQQQTRNGNTSAGSTNSQTNSSKSSQDVSSRLMKAAQNSNVFVPLQVSRSMAVNETDTNHQPLGGRPNIQAEIIQPVSQRVLETEARREVPREDPVPASNTLKALLGVTPFPEPTETVQKSQPPRKSRIAANFSIAQQS